jgi:hypothetical protein
MSTSTNLLMRLASAALAALLAYKVGVLLGFVPPLWAFMVGSLPALLYDPAPLYNVLREPRRSPRREALPKQPAPKPDSLTPEQRRIGLLILFGLRNLRLDPDRCLAHPMFVQAAREFHAGRISLEDLLRIAINLNILSGGKLAAPKKP